MNYVFYERNDEGTFIVARLIDGEFSGEQADSVKTFLDQHGWPDKEPDEILHGSRLWAAKVEEEETT